MQQLAQQRHQQLLGAPAGAEAADAAAGEVPWVLPPLVADELQNVAWGQDSTVGVPCAVLLLLLLPPSL